MGKNLVKSDHTFLFCDGGSCQRAGSEKVIRQARAYLRNNNLWHKTHTIKTRCNGRCEDAPTCIVLQGDYWYKNLTPQKIIPVLTSHLNHNTPVQEYLLFQKGWEQLQSDNERARISPNPFHLKQDDFLGECLITKGFSSDQYLFPLFQYIKDQQCKGVLQLSEKKEFNLNDISNVIYHDKYNIELHFDTGKNVTFVIGAIPKTASNLLVQQKITHTEYFITSASKAKGIRFKNKLGNTIAIIYIDQQDNTLWDYCINIQLEGIQPPL